MLLIDSFVDGLDMFVNVQHVRCCGPAYGNEEHCLLYHILEGYPNRLAALTIDNPKAVSLQLQEIKETLRHGGKLGSTCY